MKKFFLHLSLLVVGLNNLSGLEEGLKILSPVEYINGIPLHDFPIDNPSNDSIIIRKLQTLPTIRWQNLSPKQILLQLYNNEKEYSYFFRTQSFCLEDSCPQGSPCQNIMSHQERFDHIKKIIQKSTIVYKCVFCKSAVISKTEFVHHIITNHDQAARRTYSRKLRK